MAKKVLFFLTTLFLLVIFLTPVYAWGEKTHKLLVEKICNDYNCSCLNEIKYASVLPDKFFLDRRFNHNYYNVSTCIPSPYYKCPTKDNDIALRMMKIWLDEARRDSGCERWYDIGVASHYFFDSQSIWHQVDDEGEIHSLFENGVDSKLKDGVNLNVTMFGQTVVYNDLLNLVSEFESKLDFLQQQKIKENVITPSTGVDFSLLVYIIKIILIVFVAFWLARNTSVFNPR